jgi:hypothetical protein
MTPKERAEDLVRRFDEPVRDKTNYRVQAMVSMTEEAIEAAVAKEREACAELARKAAGNHPNELKRETARDIEALIRARTNGGKK